jgi:ankyrin repeat protein
LINLTDASHETPLECAARMGYPAVVRILLGLGSVITGTVTLLAARNRKNGMEVMALLLERRGDEITITEEVVETAAEIIGMARK